MPQRKEMDFKKYKLYNLGAIEITKGVKFAVSTINTSTQLGQGHHWVFTSTSSIQLPEASLNTGREYYIKNTHLTDSVQVQNGLSQITIDPGLTLHIVSDGTTWQRITVAQPYGYQSLSEDTTQPSQDLQYNLYQSS